MDSYSIVKHPVVTEKVVRLIQNENKLLFVVERRATKKQIKDAVEKLFKVKVVQVNTLFTPAGEKRAYVKLSIENPAMDIVTQLGMM